MIGYNYYNYNQSHNPIIHLNLRFTESIYILKNGYLKKNDDFETKSKIQTHMVFQPTNVFISFMV